MIDQRNIIRPGDDVRVHSGGHAGETGTAIDVIWYSDQSHMYALVRVMSDGGISHFFDLRVLEKVKGQTDNDLPSDRAKRTWKHVK
jgi:hypothetical protein